MIVEGRVLVGLRGLRGAQGGIALVEHRFVLRVRSLVTRSAASAALYGRAR